MDQASPGLPALIGEEAQDAMKYARLALDHKSDHPDLAELFMKLSGEELRHMQLLSGALAGMVETLHSQYTAG